MSGSGGGGGSLPDFASSTDCKTLRTSGSIISPNPTVLSTVSVGEVLQISLSSSAGTIMAITNSGGVLGSIVATRQADLLNCLTSSSFNFQAKITSISGGYCELQIFAK